MKPRCLNIDWLEVHCLEPDGLQPRDADFFLSIGWDVRARDYGTRVYNQMFTLLQPNTNEPLIEVRRSPVGNKTSTGNYVIDPLSCHIRLHNRTCYFDNAAAYLFQFLMQYQYSIMRISRIDLCLDFETFDSGDDPQKFIERYLNGKYSKINQANISAHGKDQWDGRHWNSLKWGSPSSMVSTKLYNKTLEIKESKDKPYIRQIWCKYGLVDDFIKLTKNKQIKDSQTSVSTTIEYKPTIWRLEFSIQSSVKKWFVMRHDNLGNKKIQSVNNTLDCYFTPEQCLNVFASLVDHYFHFKKKVKNSKGEEQRKDRCPDKILFDFQEQSEFFKIDKVASAKTDTLIDESLKAKLVEYKLKRQNKDIQEACNTLIKDITRQEIFNTAAMPWDATELTMLRLLISHHIQNPEKTVDEEMKQIKAMFKVEEELFGEHDSTS